MKYLGGIGDVGSLEWGQETGGQLTCLQTWAMVGRSVPEFGLLLRSQLRSRIPWGRGLASVDPDVMEVPDSELGRTAERCANEKYKDPALKAHAYRTIAFAHAIAKLEGIAVDDYDELLWCACVLHDAELEHGAVDRCFAVRSGLLARDTALKAGASVRDADLIGDAISRHPAPGLDPVEHPLAYLVNAGAQVDVTGRGLERLNPQFVDSVLARQQRTGFRRVLTTSWKAESATVPRGRARVAQGLGFTLAARLAPFSRGQR